MISVLHKILLDHNIYEKILEIWNSISQIFKTKFTSLYLKLQIYKIVRLQNIPTEYQICTTPVSADFREIKYSLHNYVIYL